jgi:CBS domain-containing protein
MIDIGKVRDIMTKDVLSVGPEDSLELVSQLFEKYDYDGLPVVGADRKLLGIITAYDMVVQSSGMHLPTVLNIMEKISVDQADRKDLDEHFEKLKQIKAKQIMNTKPLSVNADMALDEAAKMFAQHHKVNPIIVVDGSGVLMGVLSRYDIIRFFNEKYFQHVVGQVTTYKDPYKDFGKTQSEQDIESAMGSLSKEFLLVTRKRPLIWKYVAVAMFIAGLLAATALVIRIVANGGM